MLLYVLNLTMLWIAFLQDISNKWGEVKQLVPKRDRTLHDERIKQENNERLRRQFAQKANVVGPWIENQLDGVASIGVTARTSLEEQLNKLRQFERATDQYRPHMDELERYNEVSTCINKTQLLIYTGMSEGH